MGMTNEQKRSTPSANGSLHVPARLSSRRDGAVREQRLVTRSLHIDGSIDGEDDEQSTPGAMGRQGTLIFRKRIPWLDGPEQSSPRGMPGQYYDSKDSLGMPNTISSPHPGIQLPEDARSNRPSPYSLSPDPALRAIGSTPSLRGRARSGDIRSFSVSSQPRKSIRPVRTPRNLQEDSVAVNELPRTPGYASSDYSAQTSSNSTEPLPPTRPKKDPASYERLVDRPLPKPPSRQTPVYLSDNWLKSQADLTLRPNVSARQHGRPRQKPARTQTWQPPTPQTEWPMLRDAPKARTVPRRPVATPPPPQAPPLRPLPGPQRKPTLFAMPSHLMGSSSSSAASPPYSAPKSPIQTVPPVPPPRRSSTRHVRSHSDSLTHAVNGLETLMEEALSVARSAAQGGRNEEVSNILDNATLALRKASTVQGQMKSSRSDQPLVLSPIGSARGSESGSSIAPDSDASSFRSHTRSIDTVPTMLTKSAQSSRQPVLVDQYQPEGQKPRSRRASVDSVHDRRPSDDSVAKTPPRLYQPPSAESVVRDFAYKRAKTAKAEAARALSKSIEWGMAADYYGDTGQSVETQPGVRPSINPPMIANDHMFGLPPGLRRHSKVKPGTMRRPATEFIPPDSREEDLSFRRQTTMPHSLTMPPRRSSRQYERLSDPDVTAPRRRHRDQSRPQSHFAQMMESPYYRPGQERSAPDADELGRGPSATDTDTRYEAPPPALTKQGAMSEDQARYSGPPTLLNRNVSLKHPRRKHISLLEGQGFSLGRFHRRQPIAREWSTFRKRIAATIACMNTVFIGLIAGIYAGQVPKMQYQLADTTHKVILGNVLLFACLGVTTIVFWPLPLLHGRKPYTLLGMALILPLLFPQALAVTGYHAPNQVVYRCGLLIPRAFMGIALGFANINFLPTLFDLFGASLMSEMPHQEIVVYDDIRRQGGGVGVWLGIWSFCFVGSMSIGFAIGAVIISAKDPSWGFWVLVIVLAFFLLVNVIAPETRRSPYRRSIAQFLDGEDNVKRRVARGEVKLHISNEGPKFWWEEVWAGLILTTRMGRQPGFFVLMLYLAWMYAQVTLVILLLGALLSRDYNWQPQYVGGAVSSMAIGAFIAMPLSKANLFSRARDRPQRTDSMTMRHGRVTWSSHMLRRCCFTLFLPFAAIAYTLSSPGPSVSWAAPTIFCGLVGFLSNLAIAECVGLIMESFDTCDLQPGVNSKHRLQSMAETTRRRRTNYSAFPRVCAGFFAAQGVGFMLSAAATGVSGDVTRAVGAQISTAIVAAILLALTVLFIAVLWRWKEVQVVPNNPFGAESKGGVVWGPAGDDPEWKPVIIGNPSGKMRRVNLLELGELSRWTEIRKLNKLIRD